MLIIDTVLTIQIRRVSFEIKKSYNEKCKQRGLRNIGFDGITEIVSIERKLRRRGYNASAFEKLCQSKEMQDCRKNNNDMDRYAVYIINPNNNEKEKKIRIELQKTKWTALQFHWNYMCLLDEQNNPVKKPDMVYEEYRKAF